MALGGVNHVRLLVGAGTQEVQSRREKNRGREDGFNALN
jgi:hypothetical protein